MITIETAKQEYQGDGKSRVFPVPFTFLQNPAGVFNKRNQLRVIQVLEDSSETTLGEDTDYQVEAVSDGDNRFTGSVELFTAPAIGQRVIILRDVPFTQETDLQEGQKIDREVLENSLDKLTMGLQQLAEKLGRAVVVPAGSDAAQTANEVIADFNKLSYDTRAALEKAAEEQAQFVKDAGKLLSDAQISFSQFITAARKVLNDAAKAARGYAEVDFLEVNLPQTVEEPKNN